MMESDTVRGDVAPTRTADWVSARTLDPGALATVRLLEGLAASQIEWLLSKAEYAVMEPGERGFDEGSPADHLYLLLDGQVQFQIASDGVLIYAGDMSGGEVGGVLPYSRMTHHTGTAVALLRSQILRIHRNCFPEMSVQIPELVQRLVGVMSDRVREATRLQQQREKMMALGKLSAGLAHELNNPAAAIRSSTTELLERLSLMPERVVRLGRHNVSEEQLMSLSRLPEILLMQRNPQLKALERSRREDAIADWLDARGVSGGWKMAETFVDAGFTPACLDDIASQTPPGAIGDVLCWVEGHTAIFNLVREVASATERISSLLSSVKSYSHMDRAANKQHTHVHEGLDATLTMLGHKLRNKNVQVEKAYGEGVPAVFALPGELNQVWTNLLDNAVDAMPAEGGTLRVETTHTGNAVVVTITDNGSGIPEDLQGRIFEPFFTTKPVGEGTGLGLDIVHRIVTRQHQGYIDVDSRPGCTKFTVTLPIAVAASINATPAGTLPTAPADPV
ncbi:MAG: ATP-binding protein [Bryobacterales bacterium]|jgi:signal transduction histidine kinase|nr:ATP-binding protein [Bryobacterales bacterium]